LTIDCHCSKGTYIRSICDDLGRALGCGAVMTALRRTMAAGFSLDDTVSLEQAAALVENGKLEQKILPIETVFQVYPEITVSEAQAVRFRNGGALARERLKGLPIDGIYRVKSPDGLFLGLGQLEAEELKILKLFV
jgi:tRNA pseudouridine55 synthase